MPGTRGWGGLDSSLIHVIRVSADKGAFLGSCRAEESLLTECDVGPIQQADVLLLRNGAISPVPYLHKAGQCRDEWLYGPDEEVNGCKGIIYTGQWSVAMW